MPIYAYKCGSCGHAKDVLQKMSDTPLTQCPSCGAQSFSKQLTAPGFQLKGTGWYATDFKNSGSQPAAKPASSDAGGESAPAAANAATTAATTPAASSASPASAPASAPAVSPAPAAAAAQA